MARMTHVETVARRKRMADERRSGTGIALIARKESVSKQAVRDACDIYGVDYSTKADGLGKGFAILKQLVLGCCSCATIAKLPGIDCSREYVYSVLRAAHRARLSVHARFETVERKRASKS